MEVVSVRNRSPKVRLNSPSCGLFNPPSYQAIPLLASVGGLLIFFVFIYAVAAVQLFPKTYHWVRGC